MLEDTYRPVEKVLAGSCTLCHTALALGAQEALRVCSGLLAQWQWPEATVVRNLVGLDVDAAAVSGTRSAGASKPWVVYEDAAAPVWTRASSDPSHAWMDSVLVGFGDVTSLLPATARHEDSQSNLRISSERR